MINSEAIRNESQKGNLNALLSYLLLTIPDCFVGGLLAMTLCFEFPPLVRVLTHQNPTDTKIALAQNPPPPH